MELPYQCACGGISYISDDVYRGQKVIRCECGTTLRITYDECMKLAILEDRNND